MDQHASSREHLTPVRVVWPPPGLEGFQGIFGRTAGRLAFGGSLLVFPVLFSVAISQPFNSLGLFGGAWWAFGLASLLGLLIVVRALGGLFGFFRNARQAALRGIDLETVLQVAADQAGDMGSLIQGTRSYRSLEEKERVRAVRARVWASILFLSAAIWVSAGWMLSLLLAGRGLLGPTGVWLFALGPAGLTGGVGIIAKGVEGSAVHNAFGPLFWSRWRNAGLRDSARVWGEELGRLRAERGEHVASGRRTLLAGTLSVLALGASISIPALGFTAATAVGPALAAMGVPKFAATLKKAGEANALKYLRLEADPSISPDAAGEALHVLASMGGRNQDPDLFKSPERTYETKFMARDSDNPFGVIPAKWPLELIPVAHQGLSPEDEAYLRKVAEHPALAEFEVLGRAQSADFLGARAVLPYPADMTALSVPIPRFSGIREGSYSMVAKAALEVMDGRPEDAELTLRTLLSAGSLMSDESSTLIGSLIGYVLVMNAADGLEDLYEVTGRQEDAQALKRLREAARNAADLARQGSFGGGVENALKGMPKTVLSEDVVRGLRWEYLNVVAGLSPCVNPNQMFFGPGEGFVQFLTSARSGLVRYPSEEAYFDLMAKGWTDLPGSRGSRGNLGGMLKAILGGGPGRCAAILGARGF